MEKNFGEQVRTHLGETLRGTDIEILQVNLGRQCNLTCQHCHLQCGPDRPEMMNREVMDQVVAIARDLPGVLIDITGGAPEMHPDFQGLIEQLDAAGCRIQSRTNLAVLDEPGQENTAAFLAEHGVGLVASMPCYLEENVRAQRGAGVYEHNIRVMQRLNALGYGEGDDLPLDLVYNPGTPVLPGPQAELEEAYRKELRERFNICFRHLFTITNMPIGRFLNHLRAENLEEGYFNTLTDAFNPETLHGLMCRRQVCVDWDGQLYDCDFNLAIGMSTDQAAPDRIKHFDKEKLATRRIATDAHCYGCTAGCGSSCGGALA